MASFSYWERHPDGPFATLLAVATTYLNPEGYNLKSLQKLARRQDDEEMRVFKAELRAAIRDPSPFGLIAGGAEPAAALAREFAGEWAANERADFGWLITSSGMAWPPEA